MDPLSFAILITVVMAAEASLIIFLSRLLALATRGDQEWTNES